jgi:hypothetical protein
VRDVVSQRLLAPLADDRLFELMVGFRLIDSFEHLGYRAHLPLLPVRGRPFAELVGGRRLTLWWQRPVWHVAPELRHSSSYSAALRAARLSQSALRPDFVLRSVDPKRLLLVEVKHTETDELTSDRRAIFDALAYLDDGKAVFHDLPTPHALAVGWGSRADATPDRVVVASFDILPDALETVLRAWDLIDGSEHDGEPRSAFTS